MKFAYIFVKFAGILLSLRVLSIPATVVRISRWWQMKLRNSCTDVFDQILEIPWTIKQEEYEYLDQFIRLCLEDILCLRTVSIKLFNFSNTACEIVN